MPRSSSTWTKDTRPAPKGPGRKKGSKNRTTLLKENLGLSNWNTFKAYLESRGIDRLIGELERLKGKDYVTAWYHLAEYVRPKLHRDTAPQYPEGGDNIQNNYYLSLSIEDQIKLVELHQRAQRLAQGLSGPTAPAVNQALPELPGVAVQDAEVIETTDGNSVPPARGAVPSKEENTSPGAEPQGDQPTSFLEGI